MINPQSPLFFMHIPKTGGMSLFTAFAALWKTGIADLYDMSAARPGNAIQQLNREDVSLVCGHFSFGLHHWGHRPAYYASVVREPVARLTSLYQYCQPMFQAFGSRLKRVGGDMEKLRSDTSLSDFYFDFEQCLRGDTSPQAFLDSTSPELDNAMVRRFSGWGLNPQACPEHMLDKAKENIERYFSVVGVLERYDDTLALLSRTLGLPALARNHVNRVPQDRKGGPVSAVFAEQLRHRNRLDCSLYDWILQRFDEHMRSARPMLLQASTPPQGSDVPLWRAVGSSPLRQAAMQQGGVPKRAAVPVAQVLSLNGLKVRRRDKLIIPDVTLQLRSPSGGEPTGRAQRMALVMGPETTRKLIDALQQALTAVEDQPGTARHPAQPS